jgi:putative transposase
MTQVRTEPYYPQSDGKLERWNQSIISVCILPGVPLCLDAVARAPMERYRSNRPFADSAT